MQDKYAGDAGDFGKFVMLRRLCELTEKRLRLGVNWYRTTKSELASNDGKYISYLDPGNPRSPVFRSCDTLLYEDLRKIVSGTRSIRAIEISGILPGSTLFYSRPLPFGGSAPEIRAEERDLWFGRSRLALGHADLIFLDPDNGIQTPKTGKHEARAIKYALRGEIKSYFDECEILIIYNHRDRTPARRYIQKFTHIRGELGRHAEMRILRFKRYSVRDYVFFYRSSARSIVRTLFEKLTIAPYDFLFGEIKPE